MRVVILAAAMALLLAACGAAPRFGPAGEASFTNVNPISGSRGGSSAGS